MTAASGFERLAQGCVTSNAAIECSREGYRPSSTTPDGRAQIALWSQRLTQQTELATVRQIAGLSDAELAALAAEFTLSPRYRRTDAMRFATPLGVATFGAGLAGLMLQAAPLGAAGRGMLSAFEMICLAIVVGGLLMVALGTMKAFSLTSVELAYGRVGLYVGMLDEQHPWLYKTLLLMRNRAAQAYRETVLRERGVLRGVDCALMLEIARVDEECVMTLTARAVAEQVQDCSGATGVTAEPHLTLVAPNLIAAA
jgi:hypothetical protein